MFSQVSSKFAFVLYNKHKRQNKILAARCVYSEHSSTKYEPADIMVRLGATQIEDGGQSRSVAGINVHDDWETYGDQCNADIAVVFLSIDVTFNRHIQPICLPADDVVIDDVEGHVIGWSNEGTQRTPTDSVSRVLSNSHCHLTEPYFTRNDLSRTLCAGIGNREVSNIRDYGAGFFVLSQSRWVQFGIITKAQTNGTGHVNQPPAAVFTNLVWFTPWLAAIVEMKEWKVPHCSKNYGVKS